jgi:hypothetical protein
LARALCVSGEPDRTPGNTAFSNGFKRHHRDTEAENGALRANGLAKGTGHISGREWGRLRWTWKRAACRDPELSDGAKLLAVTLCDTFAHHETGFCNPRVETIAEALGKSDRAIQRALAELRSGGWIAVRHLGRGKTSQIAFLNGGHPEAFAAPEKVTPMASRPNERAPEKVTEASPFAEKKVTAMARKGDAGVTPYTEPKNNQKERASGEQVQERPAAHLHVAVLPGSEEAANWDAWLVQLGRPSLAELRCLVEGPQGRGHDVPWKRPPAEHDLTGTLIALRIVDWQAARKAVHHDR